MSKTFQEYERTPIQLLQIGTWDLVMWSADFDCWPSSYASQVLGKLRVNFCLEKQDPNFFLKKEAYDSDKYSNKIVFGLLWCNLKIVVGPQVRCFNQVEQSEPL